MNEKDRIWYLVSKKLTHEASAEELLELEDLLRSHPEMHYALQNITDLWNLPQHPGTEAEDAFDRHVADMRAAGIEWDTPQSDIQQPTPPRRKKRFLLPAAVMIILVA